ncbi:TetR/AcrR family transcriptional regulator [Streptomyces sp. NPDC020983]|uniref:TetR/AcrR family transcriptional regulator n=1 Tax=Streptomyces sp. NPDC020983 TaxID=3365106 RepID=UPI0037AFB87F
MPRSGAEARRRLQQAALELYRERGFDQTTTAEIAARAGLNERTYFRHFADKREVLFDGQAELRDTLVHEVATAPEGRPLELLLHAFLKAKHILEGNRDFSEPRCAVIAATPALRERELAKAAALTEAVAGALRQRGVPERLAGLAAQAGWAAFQRAADEWINDPAQTLDAYLRRAFDDLGALSAAASQGSDGV